MTNFLETVVLATLVVIKFYYIVIYRLAKSNMILENEPAIVTNLLIIGFFIEVY